MVVFSLGRASVPEVVCSEPLRQMPQQKKDNLLRQQKKTPTTPFSANSRKKTTDSSNLTITKKHRNQKDSNNFAHQQLCKLLIFTTL
jgi:hypothetical protein